MVSSELIAELVKNGIRRSTARQRLHRAFRKNIIHRKDVTLGKGQYLYFLPQDEKSRIGKKVLDVIKQRKRLNRLFEALKIRRIIPEWHVAKISGTYKNVPIKRRVESLDKLLSDLEELELGKVVDFEFESRKHRFLVLPNELKRLKGDLKLTLTELSKKLAEEETITSEITSLLKSSELGKGFVIRPPSVSVPVDALGDCKPYLRAGNPVSSKIMVEVNALWKLNDYDLEGLLDRVHVVRRESEAYSVIVYIVAYLQKSAFERANTIGWKPIRPNRLKKIKRIENLRRRGVLLLREVPSKKYRNIVRELRNLEDLKRLGNYRSQWFEDIVRDYFDELGYHTRRRKRYYIDHDEKLTERRTKRMAMEIDIFGEKSTDNMKEVVFCECKNWLESFDISEVKKFVGKLNKLYDYYLENEREVRMQGFFIASELNEIFKNGSKMKLNIIHTDDFQEYAKRTLTQSRI